MKQTEAIKLNKKVEDLLIQLSKKVYEKIDPHQTISIVLDFSDTTTLIMNEILKLVEE